MGYYTKRFFNLKLDGTVLYSKTSNIEISIEPARNNTVYIDPDFMGSTQNGTFSFPYNAWSKVSWQNYTAYVQKEEQRQL